MTELWNEFDLKIPPLITLPSNNANLAQKLRTALNKYEKQHTIKNKDFPETAALLSRLMARRKNSFRHMIGFHSIRKLNSALSRLLRIDLPRDLERFSGALPDMVFEDDICVEIPNRNSFDYVLVRLVGVYYVHKRIRECCTDAVDYITKMMRSNYFFETNTLFFATIAKLFNFSFELSNLCAELYNQILPLRQYFPHKGIYEFLPKDTILPNTLEHLGNNSENSTYKELETQIPLSVVLNATPTVPKHKQRSDVGTEVDREKKVKKYNIEQLRTVEGIKQFIAAENKARKNSLQTSLTKKILNHEWAGAQKIFEKKLLANDNKKAVNIFQKFISSKI
ncbi:uncharacterized protein LOC119670795 [Teleopsis dalmanni]|uniref:uncharacterized protein LOC119670795 n=1 Tax=Teleopsis dalmanni TaxID=139649 RepID=UPI0018CE10A2|nr:uncharacterized protein LOC119670795 [Teleopsis dalmanni]